MSSSHSVLEKLDSFWTTIKDRKLSKSSWLCFGADCVAFAIEGREENIAQYTSRRFLEEVYRVICFLKSDEIKSPGMIEAERKRLYDASVLEWESEPDDFSGTGMSAANDALAHLLEFAKTKNIEDLRSSISEAYILSIRGDFMNPESHKSRILEFSRIFEQYSQNLDK